MPIDGHQGDEVDHSNVVMLVVDDHPVVYEGLQSIFEDSGDSLHYTSSLADAFRICRRAKPEIVLVDLGMRPGVLAGLSFIRRIRRHALDVPILVLSMHDGPLIVREALKLGADGYVLKDTSLEEVVRGVAAVRKGIPYVSRALASDVAFFQSQRQDSGVIDSLTAREHAVLSQLAEGKSYKQIAASLALSYKAVAHICGRLKPKLGVRSLVELVHFAVQNVPATPAHARRPDRQGRPRTNE